MLSECTLFRKKKVEWPFKMDTEACVVTCGGAFLPYSPIGKDRLPSTISQGRIRSTSGVSSMQNQYMDDLEISKILSGGGIMIQWNMDYLAILLVTFLGW